jgi:alpha-L-arabinofuranosidase
MSRNTLIGAWLALFLLAHGICGEELSLTLHPERVLNQVDEKVYGHFLEHIYHSVNGGLWGELIWNRSFEENDAGQWEVGDGCVVQKSLAADQRLTFGNPDWEDYEFTLEAFKTGGNEGFLVLFRVRNEKDFYWCNLGGWGNKWHSLERGRSGESRWHAVGPRVDGGIESGRWYRIKVRCEGLHFSVWLDDRLLIDFTDAEGHRSGMVGVGTWATQAKFRHLEVTSLDGKMPESWKQSGGFRPDLLDAIGELRPPLIRWPGGCFASAYRWKDGIGPQHERGVYPRPIWDDLDVNSFGTDEFVAMCRRVNAQPLIVVNIGTKRWTGEVEREAFLQEVCDWIEYCNGPPDSKCGKIRAANGHPQPYHVRYWEIDNETWHMGAEAYAEAVCEFAPAMRKADPSVKLAACGSAGYGDGDRGLAWNQTIIDRCAELVDYLSIHHYENPSRFEQGPRAYEAFFRKTAELIAGSKNPKLKIYVSEWNAQSTDWRTGLYCGGLLNAFERCGDVLEMGGPALFLRHVSATAWDNAFVNFDNRTWFPAPNYVVMKLWREHYQPLRIELSGDPGPLNAVATKSEDGRSLCLKAVNPSKGAVSVSLEIPGGFAAGETAMQLVAPGTLDARNTLEAPDAVSAKPSRAAIDGHAVRFEMPPLSAAVVTIAGSP